MLTILIFMGSLLIKYIFTQPTIQINFLLLAWKSALNQFLMNRKFLIYFIYFFDFKLWCCQEKNYLQHNKY